MSSLSDFRTVWSVDFEFRPEHGREGNPLDIVCMVAKPWPAGDEVRIWLHGAIRPVSCPFAPEDLIVAFYASAEMGCFQALGWPAPEYVLDLYAEFRKHTNGKTVMCGNGLIGALTYFGCDAIPSDEKDAMRAFILKGGPWNASDQEKILDYCATDVDATLQLLTAMEPHIDLPRALLRGEYTIAVASMEQRGIPIDVQTLDQLRLKWPRLKQELIKQVDQSFGVYQEGAFRQVQFSQYLKDRNISWPKTKTGQLALDDETFKEQVLLHPQLEPLHQLRKTLSKSRLGEWPIGDDGRNRCLLSMYASKTGRNQPSTSRFIFGAASWLRGLIQPTEGYGLAYIDWSSLPPVCCVPKRSLGDAALRKPWTSIALSAPAESPVNFTNLRTAIKEIDHATYPHYRRQRIRWTDSVQNPAAGRTSCHRPYWFYSNATAARAPNSDL